MKTCELNKCQLDPRDNIIDGWGVGEKRGGKPYESTIGWKLIRFKVLDKYGDNTWIGMNNVPTELCGAYHRVRSGKSSYNVKNVTGLIYKIEFKAGRDQAHRN